MKREGCGFIAFLAVWLLINAITLSRYPAVWVDEIQFADPAVRLATGHGFTSTAWFAQDSARFFAGNVPLYSAVLGGWLSLFGPGLIAERALNLVLFACFLTLVWRFLCVTGFVRSANWRLLAIALLATGHAMTFSFRSGRYDVLGMTLAATAMNLWVSQRGAKWLPLIGLLLPAAGLQLLPAVLLACVLLLVLDWSASLRKVALLLGGCVAGWLGLRTIYAGLGVWGDFQSSTRAIGLIGHSLLAKLHSLPMAYSNDKSRVLLFAAALLIFAVAPRKRVAFPRVLLLGVLALLVLLPAAMHMAGKFPIYYGWMVYLPLTLAFVSLAAATWPLMSNATKGAALALVAMAMLVGLPLRLAAVAAQWHDRDPARVAAFVKENLDSGELALIDFKLYYPVIAGGTHPLLPTYVPAMRPAEKSRIQVLALRPEDLLPSEQALGGVWKRTGVRLEAPASPRILRRLITELREENYPIEVYRRSTRTGQ